MLQEHLARMRHGGDYADQAWAIHVISSAGDKSHGKIRLETMREREQVGDLVIMNEENSLMLNPEDDNDNDQSGKTNEWSPH